MGWVIWKTLLVKLAAVEAIHKQAQGTLKSIGTTREATRRSSQPSQVMSHLCIVGFNRIGIVFAL